MPTYINIEPALLRWQAKYNRRLTYDELAEMAGISIAALYRMKSGDMIAPDLRKINQLCKILECDPGEIIVREQTAQTNPVTQLEVERREILNEITRKTTRKRSSV
ncbi:helix-turn-helix transcriptional regulator [bacterium]|nr:helix-turn-helix transcriptional regulator [bacterium]